MPRQHRSQRRQQPVRVPTGLPYGEGKKLRQAQQAQPLPQTPAPAPSPLDAASSLPPPVAPITAPTTRPVEPLTAGLSGGPGAGPEALGDGFGMTPIDELRALYLAAPNEEIRRLLQYASENP